MAPITLTPALQQRAEAAAAQAGKSVEELTHELWEEYLEDAEDMLLAQEALDKMRRGESEKIPLTDIMRRYGIEE